MSANDGFGVIYETSGTDTILFDSTVNKNNIAFYIDNNDILYIDYGNNNVGTNMCGVFNQNTNSAIETIQAGNLLFQIIQLINLCKILRLLPQIVVLL